MVSRAQTGLTGKTIDRYCLVELLGTGGMAAVYRGFDLRLERVVAIKVLPPYAQSHEYVQRFEREAKTMARLSHPNIITIHDFGKFEGNFYLVMDLLTGGTLEKFMIGKPIIYHEAARFLAPVARALAYAHEHEVIHRDVKPANILMDADKKPILSDFGIAKLLLSEEEERKLTQTGVGIGTPDYVAPEQALGRAVDFHVDIYALGVVFYEMLTGKRPFEGTSGMQIIMKHVMEPFPLASEKAPDVPANVDEVLLKAVQKKPEDRYETMDAFADALESLFAGVTLSNESGLFKDMRGPKRDGEGLSCSRCGHQLRIEDRFCSQCGQKVEAAEPDHVAEEELPDTEERVSSVKLEPKPTPKPVAPAREDLPVQFELLVRFGKQQGERYHLGPITRLGRNQDNDIWVQDNNASRYHAEIIQLGLEFRVRDLGSTNGTWLNGKQVTQPKVLMPGDQLVIGDTEFEVIR
ncbi:MAG: protein kinase, partial [Anaerolineaceae bacterium]|nr:protein kinase [Anaerolineaceae bacterium]